MSYLVGHALLASRINSPGGQITVNGAYDKFHGGWLGK